MNGQQLYWDASTPRQALSKVIRRTRTGFAPIRSRFLPRRQIGNNRGRDR